MRGSGEQIKIFVETLNSWATNKNISSMNFIKILDYSMEREISSSMCARECVRPHARVCLFIFFSNRTDYLEAVASTFFEFPRVNSLISMRSWG